MTLAKRGATFAALALAMALACGPGVGWADDDDNKKKQQRKKDEQQAAQRAVEELPDLKIEYAGSNAAAGEQLVAFKVSNIGAAQSGAVRVRVVTLEPEPTPHRRELDVASLAPGASTEIVYSLAAPCDGHRVLATVDDPLDAPSANNRAEVKVCSAAAAFAGPALRPGGTGERLDNVTTASEAADRSPETTIVCCFQAEPPSPATTVHIARPGITTRVPVVAGGRAVYAEAGATGDGPADQAECDKWADVINTGMEQMRYAMDDGDGDRAVEWADYLEDQEQRAMDRGCFVVY